MQCHTQACAVSHPSEQCSGRPPTGSYGSCSSRPMTWERAVRGKQRSDLCCSYALSPDSTRLCRALVVPEATAPLAAAPRVRARTTASCGTMRGT